MQKASRSIVYVIMRVTDNKSWAYEPASALDLCDQCAEVGEDPDTISKSFNARAAWSR